MKGVSNVVAAIVLIGITLAGFAIAYPTLFSRVHGVYGAGSLIDQESYGKGVRLVLIDYDARQTYSGGPYSIKLWIYNSGWNTAHVTKICTPNGYSHEESITIEPGETKEISIGIPQSYGRPSRIIVVTKTRVFIFDLK